MDKEFVAAWKSWRKRNRNGWVYQLLVLLKVIKSPTLEAERAFRRYEAEEAARSMTREVKEANAAKMKAVLDAKFGHKPPWIDAVAETLNAGGRSERVNDEN